MSKEMPNRESLESGEKGEKYVDFAKSFHDLSKELAGAYSISEDIYSQPASTSRFEGGISVNQAKEFLGYVEYDAGKAESILEKFAKTHKPVRFYSGKDIPINIGVNIGSEELLSLGPDSKANGRSPTIAALAHKAARLEMLLSTNGIPDAYALAQSQTRQALKLVEKAAEKAYDWNTSWGSLNVDNVLSQARGNITRKKVAQGAMIGVLALAGCYMPVTPIPDLTPVQGASPTATEVVPAVTETLDPVSTATLEPTQTETATPTETVTPEVYDWDFVSQRSDEEIFNIVGTPNPADYSLEIELSPNKILRNEGGASYALFQNSDGIVVLAENLETRVIEHAIYAEYEGGVPVMILTDASVVEHDNGWFQLNNDYPASDAQNRFAEAFNRAISLRWWALNHREDNPTNDGGPMPSLDEIPGFSRMPVHSLTREQRRQVNDYILGEYLKSIKDAKESNSSLNISLPDRYKVTIDLTKDILIIKPKIADIYWKQVMDEIGGASLRSVEGEKQGKFTILNFLQPSFVPSRIPREPVGGVMTHFLRYFFGAGYYYSITDTSLVRPTPTDMTGPVFEVGCKDSSISDLLLNYYSNTAYLSQDGAHIAPATNSCAVIFAR